MVVGGLQHSGGGVYSGLLQGAALKRRGLPQSSLSLLRPFQLDTSDSNKSLQGGDCGPRAANPIPAGQQSVWPVDPAGL